MPRTQPREIQAERNAECAETLLKTENAHQTQLVCAEETEKILTGDLGVIAANQQRREVLKKMSRSREMCGELLIVARECDQWMSLLERINAERLAQAETMTQL